MITETLHDNPRHYMERCCLSAILIGGDAALSAVNEVLNQNIEHFEEPRNQAIYAHMLASEVVDIGLIWHDLYQQFGGELGNFGTYLGRLSEACPTSANARFYAERVLEIARLRYVALAANMVKAGEVTYTQAAEGEKAFTVQVNKLIDGHQLADLTEDHLNNIVAMEGRPQGIPTGMSILNDKVHGWRYGKYILVGARTSVGKTALAINAAVAAVTGGFPCLMFSCEMDATDIGERVFSIIGGVDVDHVRRGWNLHIQKPLIKEAARELRGLRKLHIDDDQRLSLSKIRDRSRRFVKQHGQSLIVVDYLQRVRPDGKKADKRNEVASISAEIQTLAKELQSPIICLAQVNRQGLNSQSNAETTATIQESDSPAQDADLMIFLIKPEGKKLDEVMQENNLPIIERDNVLQILISKNRMGPTSSLHCIFNKRMQTFHTISQSNNWRDTREIELPEITHEELFAPAEWDDGDKDEYPF